MGQANTGNCILRFASTFLLMTCVIVEPGFAQKASWTKDQKEIGYPTVNAAYQALTNKQGITKKIRRNLILIRDPAKNHSWQFTRPSHFAHPAVIRTFHFLKENDPDPVGIVILCEAKKLACNHWHSSAKARFAERTRDILKTRRRTLKWAPKLEYQQEAMKTLKTLLTSLRQQQYRKSYQLLEPSIRNKIPPKNYVKFQRQMIEAVGGHPTYIRTEVDWARNPRGQARGIYAYFKIFCKVPQAPYCEENVILRRQASGEFKVIEQNRRFKPR